MFRTATVKLNSVKAIAYRRKLKGGGFSLVIHRPGKSQPGIADKSKTTNDPIPTKNTNLNDFPIELFKEALELTQGLPYRKLPPIKKVTKDMFITEKPEKVEEEIIINEEDYQKILDRYTDKNGKLSYNLINKEFIKFAKSSKIVRTMIDDGASLKQVCDYIVRNKVRNIIHDNLTDKEIDKIVEMLDATQEKGIFKELNGELKKLMK